jgi:putative hemolysin
MSPAGLNGLVSLPPVYRPAPSAALKLEYGKYELRLACSTQELDAACRLRFRVFNLELGEGLMGSYATGLDSDRFDRICDHLIVEDRESGTVVGTYRMQSGVTAALGLGYYSAQEFDFSPYESIREQVLELGRASIDKEHRTSEVLTLLWRGIAHYSRARGLRYLIGCSSLNSLEPEAGWHTYSQLLPFLTAPEFRTRPTAAYMLPATLSSPEEVTALPKVPKLLRTYIGVGARICGVPAWDQEFGTIDFLTLLDLEHLSPAARSRFQLDEVQ